MKSDSQLSESIERFRRVFWSRQAHGRPPVGVVNTDVYLPIKYLRRPLRGDYVEPSDVCQENISSDYEFAFARRPVNSDDWMPFSAPWRGIPWLEAWCGCPVRYSKGALAPESICQEVLDLERTPIPANDAWRECLVRETGYLVHTVPRDCWVSPTILRGCSDVLAALRGFEGFACDLYDAPEVLERVAGRICGLVIKALEQHFALVKPKYGGYGHIFGYWAPGPTIALQEDVLGLCRPSVFQDLFLKYNAEIVRRLGPHVIFHLHSTGFAHFQQVLEIPELAGLQMTIEANGPPLEQLLPVFREVLERSRLMIFADHRYEELAALLPRLPTAGLYVVVPQRFVSTEADFVRFLRSAGWTQE